MKIFPESFSPVSDATLAVEHSAALPTQDAPQREAISRPENFASAGPLMEKSQRSQLFRLLPGNTEPHVVASPALLEAAHAQAAQPKGKFFPANYIPRLADYPPGRTGSAIANPFTGKIISARDSTTSVTAQSTTKLYMAALLMMLKGREELFATVGNLASEEAFNADSRMQDPEENHKPLNPFINIGAEAVTNRVREILEQNAAKNASGDGKLLAGSKPEDVLVNLLRELTGNKDIEIDEDVARSESETGDNNRRLLGIVANAREGRQDSDGAAYAPMNDEQIASAADNYFRQCAIKMCPEDHAKALWALEHKINPQTGKTYLTPEQITILKELARDAGNYNQSKELQEKTANGAVAKSGVGGTQIGWIYSKKPGQPDIPFGVISEGLNTFGNPKGGISWLRFMGRQNIHFPSENPIARATNRAIDKSFGLRYKPAVKTSPEEVHLQLLANIPYSQQAFLKQCALDDMSEAGRQRVDERSETGFYLKMKQGKSYEDLRKLLVDRDVNGVMKTYEMVVGHNKGGHGDHPETVGAAKIVVSITEDAAPYRHGEQAT